MVFDSFEKAISHYESMMREFVDRNPGYKLSEDRGKMCIVIPEEFIIDKYRKAGICVTFHNGKNHTSMQLNVICNREYSSFDRIEDALIDFFQWQATFHNMKASNEQQIP
jgi:hypothetical protein